MDAPILFEGITAPALSVRNPADFDVAMTLGRGAAPESPVFVRGLVYDQLTSGMAFFPDAETGGFLLGDPFRLPGSPEDPGNPGFRWGLDLTHAIRAEATVASRGALVLTGDAWSHAVRYRDRELPEKQIVGWFHTHLFPATDDFGLSRLDIDLHARLLDRPWQVALLVNLGDGGARELRCFQWSREGALVECRYMVTF